MIIDAHYNPGKDLWVSISDRTQEWEDRSISVPKGTKADEIPGLVQARIEKHIGRELEPKETKALAKAIDGAKQTDGIAPKPE